MKLIYIPLGVMLVLLIFSMLGLGATVLGDGSMSLDTSKAVYYDSAGMQKIYVANLTAIDPNEHIRLHNSGGIATFYNTTGLVTPLYYLYYDNSATNKVNYADLGKTFDSGMGNVDMSTSVGLIALVIGCMALAAVVGLRVFGSGVSEESVSAIVKGTVFLALWAVFSVLALALLLQITLLGPIIYFVFTGIYTLGIINQVGHPGDD